MSVRLVNTEVSQMVREVSRKLDSILYPISDQNNLTVMKMKVLMELSKRKKANIGVIGQSLGVAGGNISNMCKTLESEGYLKRVRSLEDERVVEVSLTKKGTDILEKMRDQLYKRYYSQGTEISDQEYDDIINALQSLNSHLDELLAAENEE